MEPQTTCKNNPDPKEIILNSFSKVFGDSNGIRVFFAPGRVNLIGEHTDYNGGYVFPGAIDKGIFACISLNGTDKVRAYSIDYDEYTEYVKKNDNYIFSNILWIRKKKEK